MKTHYQRKSLIDRRRKSTSFSVTLSQWEHLRHFSKGLLVIPTAILLLFSCGQLGILLSRKLAEIGPYSPAGVDTGPWAYVLIHPSLYEDPQESVGGRMTGIAPSGENEYDPSIVDVPPESTMVVLGVPTATSTASPFSSTPSPTMMPMDRSVFTATPTAERSPTPNSTPSQPTPTHAEPGSIKVCDAAGQPLSYDHLHYHTANIEVDGFGTIVHALPTDGEETPVILERLTVVQDQSNPRILEVVSAVWSHWGMGSTKIDVQEAQAEVSIQPNLEFYACFAEGKCDHSLYGGEIYIDFDGELSGKYHLMMEIHFPEYEERCELDLQIDVEP